MAVEEFVPPDGGWGWAITMGAFIVLCFTNGLPQSFGVFFVEFRNYFQEDAKTISIIGGLLFSMVFFLSPISAAAAAKFGSRPAVLFGGIVSGFSLFLSSFAPNVKFLYVTMGIMTGFGFSLGFIPSLGIINRYFCKKIALANSIALSGVALGTIVFPLLSNYLIEVYGWRGALIILGGLSFNVCVGASFYRPPEVSSGRDDESSLDSETDSDSDSETESECSNEKDSIDSQSSKISDSDSDSDSDTEIVVKEQTKKKKKRKARAQKQKMLDLSMFKDSYRYVLFCLAFFLGGMATVSGIVFLVPRAVAEGYPRRKGAILLSIVGILNFLTRLLQGVLMNMNLLPAERFITIYMVVFAISNCLFPFGKAYSAFVLYAISVGVCMAGLASVFPMVIRDYVGAKRFQSALGMSQIFTGLGQLLGPFIAGTMYDKTNSYGPVFFLAGILLWLAMILMLLMPFLHRLEVARDMECEKRKRKSRDVEAIENK
ncbi:monocarboxylate transporter 2-like [Glandiceps talaboti]